MTFTVWLGLNRNQARQHMCFNDAVCKDAFLPSSRSKVKQPDPNLFNVQEIYFLAMQDHPNPAPCLC